MHATTVSIRGRLARVVPRTDPREHPVGAPAAPREAVARWRLVVARDAVVAEGGQRDQLASWEAALIRSGLPMAGLDAPKPRPRFAPAAPLAAGIRGEAELVDVWLVERLPRWRVRESIAVSLPPGYRLVDLYDVWLGEAALPGRVVASVYRASLAGGAADTDTIRLLARVLLEAGTLPRRRSKGDALVAYDLRPFIDALAVVGAPAVVDGRDPPAGCPVIRMVLRHDPEKGIGRPEEVLAELGDRLGTPVPASSLVREGLVLAEPPDTAPAPQRRTGLRPGGR